MMKNTFLMVLVSCFFCLSCEKDVASNKPLADNENHRITKSTEQVEEVIYDDNGVFYFNHLNTESAASKRFDLYVPSNEEKVPLIIAFHGGSFISGHRTDMWPAIFNQHRNNYPWITIAGLTNKKIAYAAVSYPLAKFANSNNIMDALNDCKSSVDFFRANAAQYNIDPDRIILMGFSAGASAALWIGLQNLYPSIKGMVCFDPQASLDISRWESTIFNNHQTHVNYCQIMRATQGVQDTETRLYRTGSNGVAISAAEMTSLHLLDLIDDTDPEVYFVSYNIFLPSFTDPSGDFYHHDFHIHKMITRSLGVGHNKMKFMYDNAGFYWGYQHPNPETIINFCDRLF